MTDRDTMWASASGQATQHLYVGGGHDRQARRWWSMACGMTYSRRQDELQETTIRPRCRLCERTRLAREVAKAGRLA